MPQIVPDVIAVEFEDFLDWMADVWQPGQHMAIVGPTGEGKTTLAVPLLKLRKWVMALDAKGMDETLQLSGFLRITKLPLPNKIMNQIAEEKPVRLIVGGDSVTDEEDVKLTDLLHRAVQLARKQGGWTIYCDEFQILADRRMFRLDTRIEKLLIAARSKGTTVVTTFQAPSWVPPAALRQASFVIQMPTASKTMIEKVADATGRDKRAFYTMVRELPKFFALIIPKSLHDPLVLIHPPKLEAQETVNSP